MIIAARRYTLACIVEDKSQCISTNCQSDLLLGTTYMWILIRAAFYVLFFLYKYYISIFIYIYSCVCIYGKDQMVIFIWIPLWKLILSDVNWPYIEVNVRQIPTQVLYAATVMAAIWQRINKLCQQRSIYTSHL